VSQFLKLSNFEEIPIFLEPLELERKDVILLAVNNANDPSGKQMQAAPFPHPPGRLSLVSTFDIGRCFSTFSLWGTLFKRAGLFVISYIKMKVCMYVCMYPVIWHGLLISPGLGTEPGGDPKC
jgi:hypothetical protein